MHLMTTLATMHGYGDYYKDFTLYANYLHECGGPMCEHATLTRPAELG